MQNRLNFISPRISKIYFSGVLGASLSSLALIAQKKGYTVSGSDTGENEKMREKFRKKGITVHKEHVAENVKGYEALVYSAAIPSDSPEIVEARKRGAKILTRAEFLGGIISEYKHRIGVSGTHGKSTVSGMLSEIFLKDGRDVTALIGAESKSFDGNYRLGESDTVIYEACEYKRSFLDFPPSLAVVTNIEREHVDCYPTLSEALSAYREFVKKADTCVLNYGDEGCRRLGELFDGKKIFYSLDEKNADVYAENIRQVKGNYSFDLFFSKEKHVPVTLSVPGKHNVMNALAAASAALCYGVSSDAVKRGLEGFRGMKRRMEYVGSYNGADVYDDYAHHPTEIKAALDGVKNFGYKNIICVFQPHTYSRTAAFFEDFTQAFSVADEVIFADVFAAREENVYGVSSEALAKATKNGKYISDFSDIENYLRQRANDGVLILTLGAGRLNEVAAMLVNDCKNG